MITAHYFFLSIANIFFLFISVSWWLQLVLLLAVAAAAVIYHYVKISGLKNQHADLGRQLLERNELLVYASKNEQRAIEKASVEENNKVALLSKINHEVRTPMNAVLGMSSLLKETPLTSEQNDYITTIIKSGETLLKVINEIMMNDILEYSKTESTKELEAKDIDLNNCIEEVLDVFAAKAATLGIDLLYYVEDNVPRQVVGDVRRLRQILMNLVENAIKATTKGEIFIGVRLIDCKEDNRIKLEFEVRDSGQGIHPDKLKSLLKGLAYADSAQHPDGTKGTGLIICKKLVNLMGGVISIANNSGGGATFKFSIYSKAAMQPLRAHVHSEMSQLENKRILIVDDNTTSGNLLKRRLENLKMETSTASSGKEAIDILTQVSFDMIITDMDMPGMDGIQLAGYTRKQYPLIPVILLHTINDEQYKEHAELFSAEIKKPVKQHLLLEAILTQLRNKDNSTPNNESPAHKLNESFSKKYPLRILIAEDNPINQKWITKILGKLGYKSEIANNGKEVLEVVSHNQYDLILMDVQMPEMDGLEATRMIRLCLEAQPVILAMTANVMQGDRQACFQSGMDDYISKPVELNEFVSKLEKWALLIKEKRQFSLQSKA